MGTLGGEESIATDINDRGQVVGYSSIRPGEFTMHAFLWEDGEMQDLGTLGGPNSRASAVNNRGQVVGESLEDESSERAVLWTP